MVNQTKSGPIGPIPSAQGLVPPSRKVELSCPVFPSDFWTRHMIAGERQILDTIATIESTAEGDRANVQNEIFGMNGTAERIRVDAQTAYLKHQSGIFKVMHTHRCRISTSRFLAHVRTASITTTHRTSLDPQPEIWSLIPSSRNLDHRAGKIASGERGGILNLAPLGTMRSRVKWRSQDA